MATPKAARGTECSDETGYQGTREWGSDSHAEIIHDDSPFPECPRRGAPYVLREASTPHGRDAARLGSREAGAA
jgi:hypothetical protein